MISVYRVIPDLNNYQYLVPDDAGAAMKYRYDGTSVKTNWEPPSVYRANPKKAKPDIWGCMSFGAVIAVTQIGSDRTLSLSLTNPAKGYPWNVMVTGSSSAT